MDWLATPAVTLFANNCRRRDAEMSKRRIHSADHEKRLIKNDFDWSAKNRDKIASGWRCAGKSLPKWREGGADAAVDEPERPPPPFCR
jgi:hypothetical protein